ncbi:MAG: hypothetical protein MN733_31020 [Nitrososphaera sp.]|nr:hypothetical protein [Nitrososphaera sp.]
MSRQTKYNRKIRAKAIKNLGGSCILCHSEISLQIDHIHGDGWAEKLEGGTRRHVLRASKNFCYGLQLLCKSCHERKTAAETYIKRIQYLRELELLYKFAVSKE